MFKEIRHISKVSSTLDKQKLLVGYAGIPGFKETLRFIMSPYERTGISEKKAFKLVTKVAIPVAPEQLSFKEMINYFSTHNTGTDIDIAVGQAFMDAWAHDADAHWLATGLVTKNLKIGVTVTTLNKVYGKNFIPKIGVMLGTNLKDIKDPYGPWVVTEKLDGHRRLLIKENGVCKFYTRSGLPDLGLFVLLEDAAMLPDNYVYDGECLAIGNFKNALALRQATNSIMNSDGPKVGITYNVFDMLPLEEYLDGKSKKRAIDRKIEICRTFGDLSIKTASETLKINPISYEFTTIIPVPILGIAFTVQQALDFSKPIIARGFEGVMLNNIDSRYEVKRSKDLIKIKDVKTVDLRVVDILQGTGKYAEMLGSAVVDYKGFRVGVGSGFSDYERSFFWDNQERLIGQIIEVDTFGETTNMQGQLSLNAPIFKGVRYDKCSSD